ncbi:ArsR/SmtB family transcription factor [Hirschia baltica]|uniref:Transcriptional regulator, ArsR family n=1 Tax=Hirschia baltica (strain ATCC 49814 / DSM 5838 / IFAM 1418) TaxID=582402 RepID=C6XMD0_HIRBI|nr:metalloregulator ArsR/SmtB family transcription factor [Hirschia baltica]ACT58073.1 transcriptional regulator, ArsR family [Hirschia baltica ATCC 49814]
MDKIYIDNMVDCLRAAGETTRARVLALLSRGELSVGELAQVLGQSQPRLSRHMKFLTSAGLVERMPEGAWVFYKLPRKGVGRDLVDSILKLIDLEGDGLQRDFVRLEEIRAARQKEAGEFFERSAKEWDAIRALHYPEADIEAAVLDEIGQGPFEHIIDMGTGTGRMLSLIAPFAKSADGIDLSHQMLTIARSNLSDEKFSHVDVRHGDATQTAFNNNSADLVIIHQVLHFLDEPERAIQEASRLLMPNGLLLVVDFAPHDLEYLRRDQAHRHLGFSDDYFADWCEGAGLIVGPTRRFDAPTTTLKQEQAGIAVNIWTANKSTSPIVPIMPTEHLDSKELNA